jgi:hypothetical protein
MTAGFWTEGPDEYRRAAEQHITELRMRLESSEPEDRERIARELEQAVEDLKKPDNGQILW